LFPWQVLTTEQSPEWAHETEDLMGPNPHAQESDVDEAPGAAGTPDSTTPEVPASPGAAGKPGSPTGAGPASPTVSELLCQM